MDPEEQEKELHAPFPTAPYVGMRPFRRGEDAIFVGREKDARHLCDKVFSSKLTLLFGGSGLGKSSLLNTLVIPQLETEESWVFYFDAWSSERPLEILKSHLVTAAAAVSVPSAGDGSPSLTELIRLLASVDDRTIILALDQFEELLTTHGQDIDWIRAEVGALIRAPTLDVRVVISMREEFLAAMEVFRGDIPELFQSTFRLGPLDDDRALDAIVEPPQSFGGRCEPELAQRIISDLRLDAGSPGTEAQSTVALPMLQLVCQELWKRAEQAGDHVLSIKLYKHAGEGQKIIGDYVASIMPKRWSDKKIAARLLAQLAPPSGFKISQSVDDLASLTGLKKSDIQQELTRLSKAGILRTRKWRDQVRYELQHDALIDVLSPWRELVLRRARTVRRAGWIFGAAVVAAIFLGSLLYQHNWQKQREFFRNTEGLLSAPAFPLETSVALPKDGTNGVTVDPAKISSIRLNTATNYVLGHGSALERYDYLKDLLVRHESTQPQGYGVVAGRELIILPPSDWPLKLRYSSRRNLDKSSFNLTWRSMAQFLAQSWGIPVPLSISLIEDTTYPARSMTLEGAYIEPMTLEVPNFEDKAFISEAGLTSYSREFFERFRDEWILIPEATRGGPFWVVPRWSLPVWNVTGAAAEDGSGLPAFLLAIELQKQPDRLISKPAVDLLFERVAEKYPETVKEAQAARGEKLLDDLVEMVRRGRALTGLPLALDNLALYPAQDSVSLGETIDDTLSGTVAALPSRLSGPWPRGQAAEESKLPKKLEPTLATSETASEKSAAYRTVEDWLPSVEPQIRAYIGSDLVRDLTDEDRLAPRLLEAIYNLRDDIYRRFGVVLPAVKVRTTAWLPAEQGLEATEFSLHVLNQSSGDFDARPIDTRPGAAVERFIDALSFRAQGFRATWINADYVQRQLDRLDDNLRVWLLSRYSLTDLKVLLRYVIYPSSDELDLYTTTPDGTRIDTPPENSIRDLPWLLGSLVFWTQVEDPMDAPSLSQRLRDTQRARIDPVHKQPQLYCEDDEILHALENMEALWPEAAEQNFAAAIRANRNRAVESFLTLYPSYLERRLSDSIDEKCKNPQSAWLSREERIYLEDLLGKPPSPDQGERPLELQLCLFYTYPASERPTRRMVVLGDLLKRFESQKILEAETAASFAQEVIAYHDPFQGSPAIRAQAVELLKRSIRELDDTKGSDAFYELQKVCEKTGPNNWCWQALKEIADLNPDGNIPLQFAYALSGRYREDDLELAVAYADRAEKNIRRKEERLSSDVMAWQTDFAHFSRAAARIGLGWLGDEAVFAESENEMRSLLESKAVGPNAVDYLLRILIAEERLSEATKVINKALEHWPGDYGYYMRKLLVNLLSGDIEAVRDLADVVMANATDKSGALFVASLARILSDDADAERTARQHLDTDHQFVGFVTMMLYTFMSGEAKAEANVLLQERWDRIEPTTWKMRLEGGDESVWQEMLLGMFRGVEEVPRSRIFDAIQDEDTHAESEFNGLPYPRQALQCEAYFYDAMLAKAHGDKQRMVESLRKSIESGYGVYYEYSMAKFLLSQESP